MLDANLNLQTIDEVREGEDAHIRVGGIPILTGSHEGDMNCGGCANAIAKGVTPEELHQRFQTEQRLIIECVCGALNIIPK